MNNKEKDRKYDVNSTDDLYRIKQICIRVMRSHGMYGYEHDFYLYIVELFLQEKRFGASFWHLAVDFIRKEFGRTNYRPMIHGQQFKKNMATSSYDHDQHEGFASKDQSAVEFISNSMELNDALDKLTPLDRLVVQLHFSFGFQFKEIGEMMGTSEQMAFHISQVALKKARGIYEKPVMPRG